VSYEHHYITTRDVNGVGRVRVVVPRTLSAGKIFAPYPYPYPSGIRYAGTRLLFSYPRVSTGIRGYLQKYFKK